MRKTIIILLALVMVLALVSCDQDKAAEKRIVGTWRLDTEDGYELHIFKSDGWWRWESYEGDELVGDYDAKWSVDSDKIILAIGALTDYMTFSLDGDKLTLDGEVHTRVK